MGIKKTLKIEGSLDDVLKASTSNDKTPLTRDYDKMSRNQKIALRAFKNVKEKEEKPKDKK